MFSLQLEQIFKDKLLKEELAKISPSIGLDNKTLSKFKSHLSTNINTLIASVLNNQYAPVPLKGIEIPKLNPQEKRKISLSSIQDKLVQRRLYNAIYDYFDALFSDKSYAYRKNKSALKAINRVGNYINEGYHYILKSDIDNFFDSIDHTRLVNLLESHIADKRIIQLIMLFMKNGSFFGSEYKNHLVGVHQGDIISPLLSNIYLNVFDQFLEAQNYQYIRYADDFIVLFKIYKDAQLAYHSINAFLESIQLRLEKEKTYITHVNDGFIFLGVEFKGKNKTIRQESLEKIISNIRKFSENKCGFKKFIEDLNAYIVSLNNYYLKIVQQDSAAFKSIQEHTIDAIAHKVYLAKVDKKIKTKKEFKILLNQIHLEILFPNNQNLIIERIILKAYEKYLSQKTYKKTIIKVNHQRDIYSKQFSSLTTLHIMHPGITIGVSKNTFSLREKGRVIKKIPKEYLERIIIESKGVSFSSNLIKKCAKLQIPIDFIDNEGRYYAQFTTYKSSTTQMIHKQAKIIGTDLQFDLAKEFIHSKIKNQLNYLKYLNKYHKIFDLQIDKIATILTQISKAKNTNALMGYEGESSAIYWDSIRSIIKAPFQKRITFGAKDIVNSSLNYAYAILYGRIQHYLLQAGLALNISFLHTLDKEKPTLVFDLIEEFRSFIVDRTIISMFNKDEVIKLDNEGLLTKDSKQLVAKNIKEKLGSYTMWKKQSIKYDNILKAQCYQLAEVVKGNKKKYKGFIGKF